MFTYETTCTVCRQTFHVKEGTKKYQQYKVNRNVKLRCDDCERRIEDDSRKYLFNRD